MTEVLPDGWSGEAPLQLSGGNAYSWHGDSINRWLPEAAENMMLAIDKKDFRVSPALDQYGALYPGGCRFVKWHQ